MRLLKLAFRRERAVPVLAVTFASIVSVAVLAGRIFFTGRMAYGLLAWNLFLAWLPLVFSVLACERYEQASGRDWRFLSFGAAWLLFFPNAPYIFTDLMHLAVRFSERFWLDLHLWLDLLLVLLFALTGLVLGFLSLYLMQSVVKDMCGRAVSWVFVAGVACLSSFGIYLGRFMRFNSWDVVFKPYEFYDKLGTWASQSYGKPATFAFLALFSTFLFISYLMLYALTHLQPAPQAMIAKASTLEPEPDQANKWVSSDKPEDDTEALENPVSAERFR
jgi:uncharacterized membrane protein